MLPFLMMMHEHRQNRRDEKGTDVHDPKRERRLQHRAYLGRIACQGVIGALTREAEGPQR